MATKSAVVTGKSRLSFPHLFEAHAFDEDSKAKFSTRVIIPKSDTKTIDAINAEVDRVFKEGKEKTFKGKLPKMWLHPLKDGDEEYPDDDAYASAYYVNATSTRRPGVAVKLTGDEFRRAAEDEDVYGGVYARVGLGFGAYNVGANKGVSCYLNNVMIVDEGTRMSGGGASMAGDFGDEDDSLV
jgi:hypothetical protein